MGDVVNMMRKVAAQVVRLGHTFKVEYRAGQTPELSDPAAALYLDDVFLTWVTLGFATDDWRAVVLDIDGDHNLIDPTMLGMSPTTVDDRDLSLLLDVEDYVLTLLSQSLGNELAKIMTPPSELENYDPENALQLSPQGRGQRVLAAWHDLGEAIDVLPDLIAIEICDAVEITGFAMIDVLEDTPDGTCDSAREQCASLLQEMIESLLVQWRSGEP